MLCKLEYKYLFWSLSKNLKGKDINIKYLDISSYIQKIFFLNGTIEFLGKFAYAFSFSLLFLWENSDSSLLSFKIISSSIFLFFQSTEISLFFKDLAILGSINSFAIIFGISFLFGKTLILIIKADSLSSSLLWKIELLITLINSSSSPSFLAIIPSFFAFSFDSSWLFWFSLVLIFCLFFFKSLDIPLFISIIAKLFSDIMSFFFELIENFLWKYLQEFFAL